MICRMHYSSYKETSCLVVFYSLFIGSSCKLNLGPFYLTLQILDNTFHARA